MHWSVYSFLSQLVILAVRQHCVLLTVICIVCCWLSSALCVVDCHLQDILISTIGSDCKLQILDVYPEDEGKYACTAKNSAGETTTTCFISVEGELWPLELFSRVGLFIYLFSSFEVVYVLASPQIFAFIYLFHLLLFFSDFIKRVSQSLVQELLALLLSFCFHVCVCVVFIMVLCGVLLSCL